MANKLINPIGHQVGLRYKSHPWHGVNVGSEAPEVLTCFIEVVPTDTVKYEVDKESGYLKLDRPQKYSNVIPALYGFIPQSYSGDLVGEYCSQMIDRPGIKGDNDPLDICILTEKAITHGDILVQARPIGGFRLIDKDQADDKIIAVLQNDVVYSDYKDIKDCPAMVIDRLKHYFLTYKDLPGNPRDCEITHVYGAEEAKEIIKKSLQDYQNKFDVLENLHKSV